MNHHNDCNVWVGVQQCDGPREDRICTCKQFQQLDYDMKELEYRRFKLKKQQESNVTNVK